MDPSFSDAIPPLSNLEHNELCFWVKPQTTNEKGNGIGIGNGNGNGTGNGNGNEEIGGHRVKVSLSFEAKQDIMDSIPRH